MPKRISIENFSKGLNSLVSPLLIGEDESALLENYVVKTYGKMGNLTKRNGFQPYNSNQFIGTRAILSIFEFIPQDSAAKLIVNNNGSGLGYTATPYTGAFTTLDTDSIYANVLRHSVLNNRDYISNINAGVNAAKVYFYDTLNNADRLVDMGLVPCPQTFGILNGHTGGKLDGAKFYAYAITFVYDNGIESGIIPVNCTDTGALYNVSLQQSGSIAGTSYNLVSIPTGNARVTARRIYRTKGITDTGVANDRTIGTLYFLAELPNNRQTTFFDNVSDDYLVTPVDAGILFKFKPRGAKYSCVNKNRMFFGNCTDTEYAAPDVSGIASSQTTGGNLNLRAKYNYKAAYLFYNVDGATVMYNSSVIGVSQGRYQIQNYSGLYSALSTAINVQLTGVNNKITIGVGGGYLNTIASNDYAGQRIVLFRNNACSVKAATHGATTILNIDPAGIGAGSDMSKEFSSGDQVLISGTTGTGWTAMNGYHNIVGNPTAATIAIDFDSTGLIDGNYGTESAKVEGLLFYPIAVGQYPMPVNYGITDDKNGADTATDGNTIISESGLGIVLASNGNKSYKSRIVFSETSKADYIKGTNYFDINPDDGDNITGIWAQDDSIVIFKNSSIHKLYLTSDNNPDFWIYRLAVPAIGSSDGLQCKTRTGYVFVKTTSAALFNVYEWNASGEPVEIGLKLRGYFEDLGITAFTVNSIRYDSTRNWVWILTTYQSSSTYDLVLIYDIDLGQWYPLVNRNDRLRLQSASNTLSNGMIFGDALGYLVKYDTTLYKDILGLSHTDTAILSRWRSKTFTIDGDLQVRQAVARIETFGGTVTNETMSLKYKVEDVSEQGVTIGYTAGNTDHVVRSKAFANASDKSYRKWYFGIEDSNMTIGHRITRFMASFNEQNAEDFGR